MPRLKRYLNIFFLLFLTACNQSSYNSPYTKGEEEKNTLYASFSEQPKHLDPAVSYSSDEYRFIAQIYEPLYQYDYLARPYRLIPLTAKAMPAVEYFSRENKPLAEDAAANEVAYSVYTIEIKPNIYFQPHPSFKKDKSGVYVYHNVTDNTIRNIYELADFKITKQDTRELTVKDYIYQIKRLADPTLHSPILGLMSKKIEGLKQLSQELQRVIKNSPNQSINLNNYSLSGVKYINPFKFSIRIKGKDPQFTYWLAMPFFAPMPWEAIVFYNQRLLKDKNITLDWYPVGTGPYYLVENNPNKRMVMERNPNFHGELYPSQGTIQDKEKGLLKNAGMPMPFVDRVSYYLEKESIPIWTKFLQGYYDFSGISSDNFDQAIHIGGSGDVRLSKALANKRIKLQTAVSASDYYWGFNMLDPVVGGSSERSKLLRQAISIALNVEEYISIFMNGRGIAAQNPIPPGIFGFQGLPASYNPVVYKKTEQGIQRRSIEEAKILLAKAGYPGGIDKKTGKQLVLNYDVISSGGPDDKARLLWLVKQFDKLNIELNLRATSYNRFRDKMRTGMAQIFSWGWHADYPDPENFLFLLYGPNGKKFHHGENASNYSNKQYDELYVKMKDMKNTPERAAVIKKMTALLQHDAPWIWGVHPKSYMLAHNWIDPLKPNEMANNTMKYIKLNSVQRAKARQSWNVPVVWPLIILLGLLLLFLIPAIMSYRKRIYSNKKQWLDKE